MCDPVFYVNQQLPVHDECSKLHILPPNAVLFPAYARAAAAAIYALGLFSFMHLKSALGGSVSVGVNGWPVCCGRCIREAGLKEF